MRYEFPWTEEELQSKVRTAVLSYWSGRGGQAQRQLTSGVTDTGTRSEVTGGQHLDQFCGLLVELAVAAGFLKQHIRIRTGVELPGYFRPTKKWDLVVVRDGRLCAAIEMKSQVGPSFGNNFNNRTEEAVGSAEDFWVAFREGRLGSHPPWLGYLLLVEEAPASLRPVGVTSAAFPPDPVFDGASYLQRYAILCRRLMLERKYTATSLLFSPRSEVGDWKNANDELSFSRFARMLYAHLSGC